jgi:hypothetical protein
MVNLNTIGYVGVYYPWDINWKLTCRADIQSFGVARILNLIQFQPFPSHGPEVDV